MKRLMGFHHDREAIRRTLTFRLTVINLILTAVNEFVSRGFFVAVLGSDPAQAFFQTEGGCLTVHRQSLINLAMTFFASQWSGRVHLMASPRERFRFFACFGLFNSMLSQLATELILHGTPGWSILRLGMDLFYSITIRYACFEAARTHIISFRDQIWKLSGVRFVQDMLSAFSKVSLLSVLGLTT